MEKITQNSTLEEISQAVAKKQNEKKQAILNKGVICKSLYELEVKKRDLLETKRIAQQNLELIKVDLNLLKDLYWNKKEL